MEAPRVMNVNIGVLGHVDSGKTSLVAALSQTLSTAALDKHPQSRARGITLDLGFSAFTAPLPDHLKHLPYDQLQVTLVDCPGHASLIRTVVGGARIIDMMLLVIDVTKGLQAQTAECLVVGEMAAQHMVVALNKVDLLPEADRAKAVKKAQKRLAAALAATRFAGAPMVPVAARPGGGGVPEAAAATGAGAGEGAAGRAGGGPQGVEELRAALLALAAPRAAADSVASSSGGGGKGGAAGGGGAAAGGAPPFLFAIDHCFAVKGQGTVVTGTVLQGGVAVSDTIELPALKLTRQVKSIQMFKRPAKSAAQGDRAALLVPGLDPSLLERGLAAAPGSVPTFCGAVAAVDRVRFFEGAVPGRAKYHVNVGHDTLMAEATFFGTPDGTGGSQDDALAGMIAALEAMSLHQPSAAPFDWGRDYLWQDQLHGLEGRPLGLLPGDDARGSGKQQQSGGGGGGGGAAAAAEEGADVHYGPQWALLKFDQPLTAPADSSVIGARFDLDTHGEACRLAFYGRLVATLDPADPAQLARLRVYKPKARSGTIERIAPDGSHAIVRGLFKKESDLAPFEGAVVTTGRGEVGTIAGRFGASGKVRVEFAPPLEAEGARAARGAGENGVVLRYKKFVFEERGGGGGGGGGRRRIQQ